jgi:hypothetical protein
MNHYVALSLTSRKSSVHLHALNSLHTAPRTFTPHRDQLVICGHYVVTFCKFYFEPIISETTVLPPHPLEQLRDVQTLLLVCVLIACHLSPACCNHTAWSPTDVIRNSWSLSETTEFSIALASLQHKMNLTKLCEVVMRLGAGVAQTVQCLATDWTIEVRSPAEAKDFSSNLYVQTGSEAHPASCTMGTGGPFAGVKRGRGVTLTTHPHIVPRSRMRRYTSSPPKRLHGLWWDSFSDEVPSQGDYRCY